jgi:hypothetical protein
VLERSFVQGPRLAEQAARLEAAREVHAIDGRGRSERFPLRIRELEGREPVNETAEQRGIPRLVFLLGEDTEGPAAMFEDLEHGSRQRAFRGRLAGSGVTTATVTSPAELETALLHAQGAPRPDEPTHRLVKR